jgi:hypothetical protein
LELNNQAENMTKIFSDATDLWVWLGPESDTSLLAMEFLASLEGISDDAVILKMLTSMSTFVWQALRSLLERSWFYRVWIIREVAVAKDIQLLCGLASCNWSAIDNIEAAYANYPGKIPLYLSTFSSPGLMSEDGLQSGKNPIQRHSSKQGIWNALLSSSNLTALQMIRRRYLSKSALKYSHLLSITRGFFCTDPRDKVYALFFLCVLEEFGFPSVDYSLSTDQVYHQFTVYVLENDGEVDTLSYAGPNSRSPTWVPDWSTIASDPIDPSISNPILMETIPRLYSSATTGHRPHMRFFNDQSGRPCLSISAIRVSTINHVGDRECDSDAKDFRLHRAFQNWYSSMAMPEVIKKYQRYPHSVANAFWRTLLADQDFTAAGVVQRLGNEIARVSRIPPPSAEAEEAIYAAWDMIRPSYLNTRTFFVTVDGYIGLCPLQTRPGDVIVLFLGGRIPFVLRLSAWDPEFFHLAGEA